MRSRGTGTHVDEASNDEVRSDETPSEVLSFHPDARVRGAIHRSFADNPQYDLVMAQSLDEARQRLARHKPIAVLLPMTKPALLWAGDLRSRFVAPVVFCFSYSVEMSLCTSAREQGLHHFVELPGDHPSSWARNSGRISSTLEHAIGAHKRRTRGFANSTQVMPAAPRDLAISRTDPDDTSGRQRRTTLVQEVSAEELAATQAKASVPAEASQKRKQRRKRKRKAS